MDRKHLCQRLVKATWFVLIAVLLVGWNADAAARLAAPGATPGLPFTEDFDDTALRDAGKTSANWSTEEGALLLAWRQKQFGAFRPGLSGSDITADVHATTSVALGDVDGDGDPDLVVGNHSQCNRLYLNNGTADPFAGVSGVDITTDADRTTSVALGDVDGDGDLDLVAGNQAQRNRLYLNNGTADPFTGVTGSDVTADTHATVSVALGDVDGDGDLDLVAGNQGQPNRLYLNNGTAAPFAGVSGIDVTTDAHDTLSVKLGDVDGDGDLDLVVGNYEQPNRLYLNNGTADPFAGVTGSDITADADKTYFVALGDVDGDGDLDVVAGNYGRTRLYLNNGTAAPFAGVSGSDATTDVHWTYSVALGDVDGDGDLDLVTGNWAWRNRLYRNNGTATPFAGVSGADLTPDSHETYSIALGDVDGDGDLDLVAGNRGQANRLYLNDGAANPFIGVNGVDITTDARDTYSVALGDVDGDGDLDLVAGNYDQTSRLYLNNGTADPFAGVSGVDITTDADPTTSVVLGDVDGDGDLDLVAGNLTERNRLYRNNGTASPFAGVSGADLTPDSHETYSIALGDVDRDGDLDLVVGNRGQTNRLYLNDGVASPFVGTNGVDITTDAHDTYSVALGDVDGDGELDVVAGNHDQTSRLYLNNGTADPFAGVSGSDITADMNHTWSVALGDMDGDGDLDLVAGNWGRNRLYLNNGTTDPFAGVAGQDVTADTHNSFSVELGDVDGDGDQDLVAGNWRECNRLYLNNGTADPFAGVSGVNIATDTHDTVSVALGDVDGDGDLDLVAGNYGQRNRLYLNNGTADPFAGVSGVDVTTDAHDTTSVALGDVDRDGDLDLVVGNWQQVDRLYLNNGTADPFAGVSGADIATEAYAKYSIALGDVDRDGDLDLVTGGYGWYNWLYLNNGTAAPFAGVSGVAITVDKPDAWSVALGDVDGDGDLDLVAGNLGQRNRLYLNNGYPNPATGWVGSDIAPEERTHTTNSVALGDVDGDGDLDLVAGNGRHVSQLYLNNGTAAPFAGVSGVGITADVYDTRSVALGDVDGDGDLDLVTGNAMNEGQRNRLYLNNGMANPFAGVSGSDVTTDENSTQSVALGDVDGDGDLDLVAGNAWAQTNRLYLNNGTAAPFAGVSGVDVTADNHQTYSVALGDLDGDGDLDLVAGNQGQPNRLYLNNGTATPFASVTGSDITTDMYNTYSVALGDVDGDGDQDLVAGNWRGCNRLYLNNGTANPFAGVTGSDITTDTHRTRSVALGDVDGDGDLDLVAGNFDDLNRLYLNNGTADPFAGVSGMDVTADADFTFPVALGDVDRDGNLDLVAGNLDRVNRLYRRVLYHTAHGRATSLRVDDGDDDLTRIVLTSTASLPPNTGAGYWLSNDGGARWYLVRPGEPFEFSTAGTALRWRAELRSLSPARTPRVEQIVIAARHYVYLPLVLRAPSDGPQEDTPAVH